MTTAINWTLEEIAAVLTNAHVQSNKLRAGCPVHGGEDRNLVIRYDGDKLLATCHSQHCEFNEIISAIRERFGDTVVTNTRYEGEGIRKVKSEGKPKDHTVKNRTTWKLRNADGKLVALHIRDDTEEEKKVWWRQPSGRAGLGGRKTAELPLYGAEKLSEAWAVVTEGEKAADALRELRADGMGVVGTVTGATGTPSTETLSILRGRRVVLWPDNDIVGREHMGRIAEALVGVASEVRWFDWEDAPEKGDAADHPDVTGLTPTLKLSPRWSKPPAIDGLIMNMGDVIRRGVDPPEELLPDILLAGKAHNIYAPGGVGKTWVLVWLAKELVARGKKVTVFDLENGLRTYSERLEEMGADEDALNEYFVYGAFPNLEPERYARFLDEWQPDIVMFDSWIGFLAADGRDENVSNDISAWADAYSKPSLRRGVAVLVLDHVPHEHERERGSSRKRDEMDVVWKLKKVGDFDRDQTAMLSMTRQKDREGWLPDRLTFEIGGDPEKGFVMRRNDDRASPTITILSKQEKAALTMLETFGNDGASTAEWLAKIHQTEDLPMSKATLHRCRRTLLERGKIVVAGSGYAVKDTPHIVDESEGVSGVSGVSRVCQDTFDTGAPGGVSEGDPLKGVSPTLTHPPSRHAPSEGVKQSEATQEERERKYQEMKKKLREKRERG